MINNKIILLNGPAGSGKDTVGRFLVDKLDRAGLYKFADPIKRAVAAMFNLNEEEFEFYFETQQGKNNPSPRFLNKTPREWLISFSEDFAKKMGGRDVFGNILADKLNNMFDRNTITNAIVTDSGFKEEAEALLKRFPDSAEVFLIRLHRKGFNFSGDSRGYIYLDKIPNVTSMDVVNDENSIEKTVETIYSEIKWSNEELLQRYGYQEDFPW